MIRVVSFALLLESLLAALYLSQLISVLSAHDVDVVAVILLRGVVGALQFTAAWLLMARRPAAVVVARWAVVAAAIWVLVAVGFNRAPTDVYAWWRWQATAVYGAYAVAILAILNRLSKGD